MQSDRHKRESASGEVTASEPGVPLSNLLGSRFRETLRAHRMFPKTEGHGPQVELPQAMNASREWGVGGGWD